MISDLTTKLRHVAPIILDTRRRSLLGISEKKNYDSREVTDTRYMFRILHSIIPGSVVDLLLLYNCVL